MDEALRDGVKVGCLRCHVQKRVDRAADRQRPDRGLVALFQLPDRILEHVAHAVIHRRANPRAGLPPGDQDL